MVRHSRYSKNTENVSNLANLLLSCCMDDLIKLYETIKNDFPDRMMFVSSVQFIDAIIDSVIFYKLGSTNR